MKEINLFERFSNSLNIILFKQNIFGPNEYLFELNHFFFKTSYCIRIWSKIFV